MKKEKNGYYAKPVYTQACCKQTGTVIWDNISYCPEELNDFYTWCLDCYSDDLCFNEFQIEMDLEQFNDYRHLHGDITGVAKAITEGTSELSITRI